MSRRENDKGRLPPFVPLLINTLDTPAWRALSHGARSLYIALKRRYSTTRHNNGIIFLSQRMAAKELGSHHTQIARWYRELQHYGFIVQMSRGGICSDGTGYAAKWRLTELGYTRGANSLEAPTRDFERWDGTPFRDDKKKTRAGNPARSVLEIQHNTTVLEIHPPKRESVPEIQHKRAA